MTPLRIAILCHSVNPRGGVVHGLELAEALVALGHEPALHAPDVERAGFFRSTACAAIALPARRATGGTAEMVRTRIADYLAHFDAPSNRRFDVWHAQDGISGNALADMKVRGQLRRFARTVHHVDAFSDPALDTLQRRAILSADAHFAVSALWRDRLAAEYGLQPTLVRNGVDLGRFKPSPDGREARLRDRLGLGAGPVVLAIGGVERRKNTVRILEAFRQVARMIPGAQLVIAGGVSLLDHSETHAEFSETLAASKLTREQVILAGPIADADMPALYRAADVLAFPSLMEGFGLVVLEAMASGVPAVVSRIAPFTEYLGDDDVAWCDPLNPGSIANAVMTALTEPLRSRLGQRGYAVAALHDWGKVASAHLATYERLLEPTMPEMSHA